MKIKPSIFFIILIISALVVLNDRIMYILSPSVPFIFNLETKPIEQTTYLHETNSKILPIDTNTIGIYSTKADNFLLKEIFQTSGVSYYMTDKLTHLQNAPIIFLDLDIDTPDQLSQQEIEFLYRYVKNGGILIGNEILSTKFGAFKQLFGYKDYVPTREHTHLILQKHPFFYYLDTKEERKYTISNINISPYTNSIIPGTAKPIAMYEDSTPAITINQYGKGKAINLGMSLYDLRYRNLIDQDFNANQNYINSFEPLSDFIIMFIRGLYESTIKHSILLHTAPNNKQASIILTHDIETESDLKSINKFISTEKSLNIPSTCFINVKYLSDNTIDAFFKPKNFPYIQNMIQQNIDIGVLAKPFNTNFFLLPFGTCQESYPMYQKFGLSDLNNSQTTLCGELKVSKELLQGIGVNDIVDFRSSELIYNKQLPKAMQQLGYRYASTFSAEDVLSYFPYRHLSSYDDTKIQSKIWEIPVSLDDSSVIPMYIKSSSYISLFNKIYHNGAILNIRIRPNKKKYLDSLFIDKLYNSIPSDVWKCTIKEFGNFWDKRDKIIFRYHLTDSQLILKIYSPVTIKNLSFKTNGIKLQPQYGIKIYKDKFTLDVKMGLNIWTLNLAR